MPVLSVAMMVWNRPMLTLLTLRSSLIALQRSGVDFEFVILDQGSSSVTRQIVEREANRLRKSHSQVHLFRFSSNRGIARGWQFLIDQCSGDYVLFLENDWFCDSYDGTFLGASLEILEKHEECEFVKLRKLLDRNDFGFGKLEHSPWTVPEGKKLLEHRYTADGRGYYLINSQFSAFTLNPILVRSSFLKKIKDEFVDIPSWHNPLRSGEEGPSRYWRQQLNSKLATLTHGPFRHTGFYSPLDWGLRLPLYFVKFFANALKSLITR